MLGVWLRLGTGPDFGQSSSCHFETWPFGFASNSTFCDPVEFSSGWYLFDGINKCVRSRIDSPT